MALDFKGLLDRIKQKINPNVSYSDQRTGARKTGKLSDALFGDPGQYWIGRAGETVAPRVTEGMTPIFGQETAGNIGQFFQGAANTTGILNPSLYGNDARANANQYLPTTPGQQLAKDAGVFATGTVLTSPLLPGSTIGKLIAIGKNALIGGAFGAGATTVSAGMQGRLPTQQELGQGAYTGVKNSWVYPATNKMTDMLLRGTANVLPSVAPKILPLTDEALSASGQAVKSLAPQGVKAFLKPALTQVGKTAAREGLETPLETAYFAGADETTPGNNYLERYANRFGSDLISNVAIGGARSTLGLTPSAVKAGKVDVEAAASAEGMTVPAYLMSRKAPGAIDFSAEVGGKPQETLGEMQTKSQSSSGKSLLAEYDTAINAGKPLEAERIAKQIVESTDPMYEGYKNVFFPRTAEGKLAELDAAQQSGDYAKAQKITDLIREETAQPTTRTTDPLSGHPAESLSGKRNFIANSQGGVVGVRSPQSTHGTDKSIDALLTSKDGSQPAPQTDTKLLPAPGESTIPYPPVKNQATIIASDKGNVVLKRPIQESEMDANLRRASEIASANESTARTVAPPSLPAPKETLALPPSRPTATITRISELQKLAKTGADLSDVTFVAKTRADRQAALKTGLSGTNIVPYTKAQVPSGKTVYTRENGDYFLGKDNEDLAKIDVENNKAKFGTEPRKPAGTIRSFVDRTVMPILNRIRSTGKSGEEISRVYEEANMDAQQISGEYNNQLDAVGKPLSKQQRADFADYVEGKKEIDSPELQTAVDEWNKIAKELYERAKAAGLDTGFIEKYFPHKGDYNNSEEIINMLVSKGVSQSDAEKRVAGFLSRSGARRFGSLDYSRDFPELEYKKNFEELYDYVRGATTRARQAETFGPNDEVLYGLANQTSDSKSVKQYLDQLLSKEKYSGKQSGEEVSGAVRSVQTILKLNPITAALNLTQNLNTIARTDHTTFVKALIKVASNPDEAWKRAQEVGEIQPDMVKVFGEEYNNGSATSKWIKLIGMYGTERFNRVMAVTSGDIYAKKLMEQAGKGDGAAMRELGRFGIDWKSDSSIEAAKKMVNKAAIKTSQQTQFSAPEGELPANWQTPAGKVLTQFKSFAYQQTKGISREAVRAVQELKNGNAKPLINDLVAVGLTAPLMGEVLADFKALIRNKDREDMTLTERYFDNLKEGLSLGLVDSIGGLFGDYGEKGIISAVGGPTVSDIYSGIGAVTDARAGLENYDPEKNFLDNVDPNNKTRRWLTGNIPVVGKTLSNTFIDNAGVDNVDTVGDALPIPGAENIPWLGGVNEGLSKPDKDIYRSLQQSDPAYAETFKKENRFDFDKDKLSLTDVLAGKTTAVATGTVPPVDAPPAVQKKFKKALTEKIDLGQELTPEETAYYHLDNKTLADQKEYKDVNAYYAKLYELDNNEDISPEAKKVILEKSGVDPKDWDYYKLASASDEEKLQSIITTVTNAKDTDSAMVALLQGKRTVGNKSMFTSTHAEYLYDRGLITKDQKALLNAVKYDELFKQFYVDRDFEGSIGGGAGGGGGASKSKLVSLMKQVYSAYGDVYSPAQSKIKGAGVKKVSVAKTQTPIASVLSKKKRDPGKLWFKAY